MLLQWQSRRCTESPDTAVFPTAITPPITSSTFSLALRESNPSSILKRLRPQTDVDGENSVDTQRKKRRLRVDLVTSRLSQPYATPTTHISSRKTLRRGPWARPRYRVRSPLRRAAILNAFRARRMAAKHLEFKEDNLLAGLKSPQESEHLEVDLVKEGIRTPRDPPPEHRLPQQYLPSSPSPLGPSNYAAFDEEEDPFDGDYDDDDAEDRRDGDTVYSNFNRLSDTDNDVEDYDSLDPFSGSEEADDCPLEVDGKARRRIDTIAVTCG
ncbi:MAG: hypothetical protein LQ352_001164 [Teloschistes flavicans]|nr:MAG: hypothetical protein LQ352_001164 [Teloschistes flavicans]